MQVTVSQPNLAAGLALTGRAVSTRTIMPVLANVLLSTDGDRLKLSATNREMAITCWIGAKVEDEGAITIPARLLTEFVNGLPDAPISIELLQRTQTLHLECGKFSANIKGIDAADYPLIESIPDDAVTTAFVPYELQQVIDCVVFAAATDENRPTLTGVNMVSTDDGITVAATDGFRLSTVAHDTNVEFGSIVVPSSALGEVARIAADAAEIQMWIGDRVYFMADGNNSDKWQRCEIISELIDALYPDYKSIVPTTYTTHVQLGAKALLSATKVALLFARDHANIVRFSFQPATDQSDDGVVRIAATSAEMGDSVNEITATVNGEDLEIAFNAKLVIDALSHFTDDVVIELTQANRPGLFYAPGHRELFSHVIMPMSLAKG